MKIILRDNFDRKTSSEVLIATGLNRYYARRIVIALNDLEGGQTLDYFVAVEDNYKLYEFKP